jgi:hypothetical protein
VGLKSLKSLNLTNGYPNKNNNKSNNKVKSKPLELRSRVKNKNSKFKNIETFFKTMVPFFKSDLKILFFFFPVAVASAMAPIINEALIGAPKERIINGRKFVCHPVMNNGKHGVAIVFDRRHHNDMRKLYHNLNQLLSSNGLRKVFSSVQLISRGQDEITRLQRLDSEYTSSRKTLMLKRSELFKDFSAKLNFLPNASAKKSAVLALKDGFKKIKESKAGLDAKNKWDETIMPKIDPYSQLHPTESETNNTRNVSIKIGI